MVDPAFTRMLNKVAAGEAAEGQVLPLVYEQLRRAAQLRMIWERRDHTLSATALVHEAYLKLVGPREIPWRSRAHFYAAAAEAMRQVLLDHAKARARVKRHGRVRTVPLAESLESLAALADHDSEAIVRFDEVFRRLETESPEAAAVVRLRFFAGLSIDQIAQTLGMSPSTVDRRWSFARAWLFQQLSQIT